MPVPAPDELATWCEEFLRGRVWPLLPRAEERPGQVRMVRAVARTLAKGATLLCEAGTGTGKTLAYLVPALAFARATGRPVVVSTATVTLQQQLLEKDLPVVLRAWGEEVRVALAKGRGNYACLRKAEDALAQLSLYGSERALLAWLRECGHDGDLRHLPAALRPEMPRIAGDETCTSAACPYVGQCFYFRARRRWERADLIVCNHALLMADLLQRRAGGAVLPDAGALVVDEAHELEEAARGALERVVSGPGVQHAVRAALSSRRLRAVGGAWLRALRAAAAGVEASARALFALCGAAPGARPYTPFPEAEELAELLRALADTLRGCPAGEPAASEAEALARWFDGAAETLEAAGRADGQREVAWVRVDPDGTAAVHVTPLDVGATLEQELLGRGVPVVLTSATLAVAGRLDAFARRVGVRRADVIVVPSPFDYRRQCLLWVPSHLPEPNDPRFGPAAVAVMREVIDALGGRTLVLFTAYESLQAAARALRATLPYPVLVQGEADRAELLARFRDEEASVLLGTASFWQGVDVAGPSLSCVIIERLPFAVPDDPVHRALQAAAERAGQSGFGSVTLPDAVLRFRQGCGRLIRSRHDRGLLVVLDRRIVERPYGRVFLNSLPGYRRVGSLAEAVRLLGLQAAAREPA